MKKNMGSADKIIRILIAAMIITLYVTNVLSGTVAIILLVIAGIFVLTSFVSFCPVYTLLGVNTCANKSKKI